MNLKNNGKNKISSDIALNRFSDLCPRITNEGMDTRVKPEYDEQGDGFLGNDPRMTKKDDIFSGNSPNMTRGNGCPIRSGMTNEEMSSFDIKNNTYLSMRCRNITKDKNPFHLSSSDLIQENPPLSSLCMGKENTLSFSPLDTEQENSSPSSSSDLIRRSTESKNDIDMNIMPNGCPIRSGMTIRGMSSSDLIQENTPLSCSNLSPSSCSNLSHLSSSDLIGGSIKDEVGITLSNLSQTNKDYIDMDITLNRFSGLCPRMTNREASSLCTTQENTSHLSSSDLIGGSIKDEGGITLSNLSQTKKGNIHSNNLLQQKERNSNNSSQRKGYTMNPTILPQQNDFNTNPNNLPQQKEYNTLSNNLPKKKGYNMKQINLSQSGRSMVEMLGVLAIIGVLSVGGIMGYSYGMDKWRANETIKDINLRAIDLLTQLSQGKTPNLSTEWGDTGTVGYPITLNSDYAPFEYFIKVENVPFEVCEMIAQTIPQEVDIWINNATDDAENTCNKSQENSMDFFYKGFNPTGETPTDDICNSDANCTECQYCKAGYCVNLADNTACANGHCEKGVCFTNQQVPVTSSCSANTDCGDEGCATCTDGACAFSNGATCTKDEQTGFCYYGVCDINRCSTNDDCPTGQYCGDDNSSTFVSTPSICRKLDFTAYIIDDKKYYMSNKPLTYWDAQAACSTIGKGIVSVYDLFPDWHGKSSWAGTTTPKSFPRSNLAKELYKQSGIGAVWGREKEETGNNYRSFVPALPNGLVQAFGRNGQAHAVCE